MYNIQTKSRKNRNDKRYSEREKKYSNGKGGLGKNERKKMRRVT